MRRKRKYNVRDDELMRMCPRKLEVAIVVTCKACGWQYSVITFHCGGWARPRPGKCERCDAVGSRWWVWARMFLRDGVTDFPNLPERGTVVP